MISTNLTLALILGWVCKINADYIFGKYNSTERIYRLFNNGTHWKSYVYTVNEELFPEELNAKGLDSDIYEFSIDQSKLNVKSGEVFSLSPELIGSEFDSKFIYDEDISNRNIAKNYGIQSYGAHIKTIVTAFMSIEVPPDCQAGDIGEKVKTRLEWFITNLQRVEIVGKRKNDDGRKNDTQIDYAIGLIYRGRAKQEDLNKQLRFASTDVLDSLQVQCPSINSTRIVMHHPRPNSVPVMFPCYLPGVGHNRITRRLLRLCKAMASYD